MVGTVEVDEVFGCAIIGWARSESVGDESFFCGGVVDGGGVEGACHEEGWSVDGCVGSFALAWLSDGWREWDDASDAFVGEGLAGPCKGAPYCHVARGHRGPCAEGVACDGDLFEVEFVVEFGGVVAVELGELIEDKGDIVGAIDGDLRVSCRFAHGLHDVFGG